MKKQFKLVVVLSLSFASLIAMGTGGTVDYRSLEEYEDALEAAEDQHGEPSIVASGRRTANTSDSRFQCFIKRDTVEAYSDAFCSEDGYKLIFFTEYCTFSWDSDQGICKQECEASGSTWIFDEC